MGNNMCVVDDSVNSTEESLVTVKIFSNHVATFHIMNKLLSLAYTCIWGLNRGWHLKPTLKVIIRYHLVRDPNQHTTALRNSGGPSSWCGIIPSLTTKTCEGGWFFESRLISDSFNSDRGLQEWLGGNWCIPSSWCIHVASCWNYYFMLSDLASGP